MSTTRWSSEAEITINHTGKNNEESIREVSRAVISRRHGGRWEYVCLGFVYEVVVDLLVRRTGVMIGLYQRGAPGGGWSKAAGLHIYNRRQGAALAELVEQCWPTTGEIRLVAGPTEPGGWSFRLDTGCWSITLVWPPDVELTRDELLRLAWDKAPDPSVLTDITLSAELLRLLK